MKKSIRPSIYSSIFMALLVASSMYNGTWGCGSGSSSGGTSGDSLGSATSVTGTVVTPNGVDPISGATVYIGDASTVSVLITGNTKSQTEDTITATCDDNNGGTVTCTAPDGVNCASTCSCNDGTYALDTSNCPTTSTTVNYTKGQFEGSGTLDCSSLTHCTSTVRGITGTAATRGIAVVTGAYDTIEDVLAKIGFGEVDADGHLIVGTEDFAIYRGGGSIDTDLSANPTLYPTADTLFNSLEEMQQYHMIFINCGADENTYECTDETPEEECTAGLAGLHFTNEQERQVAHLLYHQNKIKNVTSTVASRVRSFVEGGGTLYVTDQAYDYVEKAFPTFMNFEGDDSAGATVSEIENRAQLGSGGIVTNATVENASMRNWLLTRSSNTLSADAPGTSCTTTANGSTTSLNEDGSIRIGDFLPAWAVMNSVHSEAASPAFVWITGAVDFTSGTDFSAQNDVERPLTVSQRINGSGCVLYSSYHTAESCPTTGYWPQERILQYLVFEVADKCVP